MAGYLKKTNCRIRFGAIGAVVLLASLCGSCSGGTQDALAAAEHQIRAAGQPLTLDELNAYYPEAPVGQNAAFVYGEAFDQLDSLDPGADRTAELLNQVENVVVQPMPDALHARLSAHVRSCAKVFATLDRAVAMARSRYSLDLRQGFNVELPHLARMRSSARLEVLRGTLALYENRPQDFVRSQRSMLRIAGSVDQEPLLISQLVRIAVHGIAVEALERGLRANALPEPELRALQEAYWQAQDSDAIVHAYVGERCVINDMLKRLAEGSANVSDPMMAEMRTEMEQSGIDPDDRKAIAQQRLVVLTRLTPLTAVSDVMWPERIKAARQLEAELEADAGDSPGLQVLTPALVSAVEAFGRDVAILRNAQLALAVERFRVQTGELPENVMQLVPDYLDAPIEDPFDGEPLRYKRLDKGYKVYSVYADLEDNGGRQAEPREHEEPDGDWVFEVRR